MSIRNGLEKVLREYKQASVENFTRHPLAHFIRHDLVNSIAEASDDPDRYIFKGSAGQGNWALGPWVAIFNPIVTTSTQRGFYPVYLFREDMAGLYLSLNQAMTEQKNQYKADAKTVLRARAGNFRALLGPHTSLFKDIEIDLAPSSPSNDTAFYEAGNILAKYYARESIPADEVLIEDLQTALSLYDNLIDGEAAYESETQVEGDEPENLHYEDATRLRLHKRIERNAKLAEAAKKALGCTCQICGLNFEDEYGAIGKGFIEAHHLEPLHQLKGKKIGRDPKKDFAVLCSNCHRMIHRTDFVGDLESFRNNYLQRSHKTGRDRQ